MNHVSDINTLCDAQVVYNTDNIVVGELMRSLSSRAASSTAGARRLTLLLSRDRAAGARLPMPAGIFSVVANPSRK